jgi:hypothetical protein
MQHRTLLHRQQPINICQKYALYYSVSGAIPVDFFMPARLDDERLLLARNRHRLAWGGQKPSKNW